MALLNEVTDSESILISVAAGEALVGHIEESEVALVLDNGGDLLPLLGGGINTGGVVSTGVEEEDAALGSSLEVSSQTLEVKTNGLLVVVAVLLNLEAGVGEDGLVVGPRGGRDVDLLSTGVELLEEGGTNSQSTGSGDGLGDGDAVEGGRVSAVGELGGSGSELGDTSDASILLVQLVLDDLLLGLANRGKNVGLASVITVGTDT